jgi:hypothetical protein
MNKAIAVTMLVVLGLIAECSVVRADDRTEIAAGVAACVNAAMSQGHRSEAFSVAYCRCLMPQMVHSMPENMKKTGTKEQAQNFTAQWLEDNPVALGACLKTGEVAEGRSGSVGSARSN